MSEFMPNCSLCEECYSLPKFQTGSLSEGILSKLYEFACIICVVIALHLIDIMANSKFELQKMRLTMFNLISRKLLHIVLLSVLILTLPLITLLIIVVWLYKIVCSVAIKRKDKRFVKFLDSFDVFCCLEDKSTTDIQGVIRSNTIELAVDNIKEKLRKVFANYGTDKIFYRRNEEYGFYYWRRYSFIDLAQYVEIAEVPKILDKNKQYLETVESVNQIVSYNDEGLFKVLIMQNKLKANNEKEEFRIVLKFHHSIKDAALIEFVARLMDADDCHVTVVPTTELQDYESPDAIVKMIIKLCGILASSFDNNINPKVHSRNNCFVRMKTLEWTESNENFLSKVKDVRDNVNDFHLPGTVGDALATVLRKLER